MFCNWYRHESCCLPAHDAEIAGLFQALVDAGDSCAKFQNRAKHFLAVAACFGCDPDEPRLVAAPLDAAFFSAARTLKVCASVATRMAPALFADCGLTLADDRNSVCSPNSAVVPEVVWPDCAHAQFVCQHQQTLEWSCADAPCGAELTPPGFADAPCNASAHTCAGALKMLNDNRAAKPVNYEALPVEIVDEQLCLLQHDHDADKCRCLRAPSSSSSATAYGFFMRRQRHGFEIGSTAVAAAAVAFVTVFNAL